MAMTAAPMARRLLSAAVPVRPGCPGFGLRRGQRGGSVSGCGRRARRGMANRAQKPPPFPTVAVCPAPTCACAPMPAMPTGLPLDQTSPLNGLISRYDEQVLVCTGTADWPSRIEDEHSGDNLAADLKELFGRGGKYSDPYHTVSVINTSFPSSAPPRPGLQTTSVYLLPSFRYVPVLPRVSFASVDALARGFLLPARLHAAHDGRLSPAHRDLLTRQPAFRRLLGGVRARVADVLVLVCGHGGRDARCGVLGPVLQAAFEAQLARVGVDVRRGPVIIEEEDDGDDLDSEAPPPLNTPMTARVGLISHIGGHKFAGNVIVNLPPGLALPDGTPHPLAGYGVWYGRVMPEHVEGLVQETIVKGTVVEDHFRGAINPNRQVIRL